MLSHPWHRKVLAALISFCGAHVTSAQVLLSVDVASFDVIASSQREHGEEDEAKMPDVLSRTLGQLLSGHLLVIPRTSFHDRAVQLDPLLYL